MAKLYSPLESVLNFRDVGDFVNQTSSVNKLRTGLLFRSARPDEATVKDREALIQTYGIRSIIDLRTKTEHIEQAQKRDAKIKASAAIPQTNEAVAEPLKIPGIYYFDINFNGTAFSRMLLSKLTWSEFSRLAWLMVRGYRLDAIKVLAPHMEELGLIGLAQSSLDVCTREVKQIFDILGDEQNWPVLIHCTQGKDRTGLIVMLLLFLLEVDQDVVSQDYQLSEPELEPEKGERMKEIQSIGLSERFAVCPTNVVSSVQSHISTKYGTTEEYLKKVGVSVDAIERIKGFLAADTAFA